MASWRRYTFVPAGDAGGGARALVVRPGRDRDGAPWPPEVDGRPLPGGRPAAAWLLARWRRQRAQGASLWRTRFGEQPR